MTTPTDIPSMNRAQLIGLIESHGARYAAENTTPLHAAAAMVEGYVERTTQVFRLTNELDTARRELGSIRKLLLAFGDSGQVILDTAQNMDKS